MNERLRKLRRTLDLTQQEFANALGVKRNTVATYEAGKSNPSDAAINNVCKTFNVNEEWLRYGTGEMLLPVDRTTEIAKLTKALLNEEESSFKSRLISALANMSEEQWEALASLADSLAKND